jgi:hypothetical protein
MNDLVVLLKSSRYISADILNGTIGAYYHRCEGAQEQYCTDPIAKNLNEQVFARCTRPGGKAAYYILFNKPQPQLPWFQSQQLVLFCLY